MQTKTTDNATAHEQRSRTCAGARGAFWGAALTALLVTGWTMAASRSPETSSGVSPVDLYLAHGGIGLEWLLTPTDGGAIPTVGLAPGTTVTATIPAGSQVQISNGLDAGPMGTAGNPIVNTPTGPGSSLAAPGYAVEMAMKPDGGAAVPLQLGPNGATTVELAAGSPGTVYTNPEYMVCQQADGGVPHFVQDNVSSIASPGAQVQEFVNLDGGTTAVSPTQGLPIQPQANVVATGTFADGTGSAAVTMPSGCSVVGVQMSGTWTGTMTLSGSIDGVHITNVLRVTNGVTAGDSWTANGDYFASCVGLSKILLQFTAWTPYDAGSAWSAAFTVTATTGSAGPLGQTVYTTPATGSPGSSTTYPMPVYTPATTASNGNQALAAGLIALGDAGYNAATQVPIPDAGLNGYQTITVQNMGTSAVWCGPASTVNSVSGQQLDPSPDGVHAGGLYSSPLPTYCWSAAAMTSPNDLRWSEVK